MREHVYLVVDPQDGKPRYVGLTRKPRQRRQQHQAARACYRNQELTNWERGLKASGQRPIFEIIETVITYKPQYGNMAGRKSERFWIDHFRKIGAPLFNQT